MRKLITVASMLLLVISKNSQAQQIINNDKFIVINKPVEIIYDYFNAFEREVPSYKHAKLATKNLKGNTDKTIINFIEDDAYTTFTTDNVKEYNRLLTNKATDNGTVYILINSKVKAKGL